jgi:hypothetical protein
MYTFEEAEKEYAANAEVTPEPVVNRLSSFKASLSAKNLRQPSFFQKMFSNSKLNRVHSEYFAFPESEAENLKKYNHEIEGGAGYSSKKGKKRKKDAGKSDDMDLDTIATDEQDKRLAAGNGEEKDSSDNSISKNLKTKKGHRADPDLSEISEERSEDGKDEDSLDDDRANRVDENVGQYPQMPRVGKPVNIDRLVNRTKAAASGIRFLMVMIENDVAQSIQRAKSIPVSKELDRVQVTPQISAVAAKVRSTAQVKECVESNMTEIQRNLNYRKSALIMMNVNYSNQRVRRIEPIYVQEARNIITYK